VLQTRDFGHWSEKIDHLAPAVGEFLRALDPTDQGIDE
jgi:hypothetical protein